MDDDSRYEYGTQYFSETASYVARSSNYELVRNITSYLLYYVESTIDYVDPVDMIALLCEIDAGFAFVVAVAVWGMGLC